MVKKIYNYERKINMNSLFFPYIFLIPRNIKLSMKKTNSIIDFAVLLLLAKISRKVYLLFSMSNFELEQEKEDKARDLYQTYVSNYNSNMIFGTGEEEPIGKYCCYIYMYFTNFYLTYQ